VLPNLIVAGAGKSGTSSLHGYLDQHPDIVMTSVKEPHFFSDLDRYAIGPQFYDDLFPAFAEAARYRGESSTGYQIFPGVPERLRTSAPDCRLVFLLRNPVDRAISHYRWLVALGIEARGFRATFDSDRDEVPDPRNSRAGTYGYLYQEGCYATNLDRFAAYFPPEQIGLLASEQLRADPLASLNQCCRFLDLEPFVTITAVSENETAPQRHPRARARIEGRAGRQSTLESRARTVAKRVLGDRLSARARTAAIAALGSKGLAVPIDISRAELAEVYAREVATLRARESSFSKIWLTDFPA
jgi:hypothetical protein